MQSKKYQIIARKYRPQTFAEVVGQDAIVTTLKNELRSNRIGQAYLFCGCRGTGKTTLARLFAKALNCHQLTSSHEPCNQCPSCLALMSGRSLDILEIDGASNRGIDDIREINETVGYAPSSGKYKIYIIDEVHMLTKEAFNALLKTLEEPPSHVKFFFATTEPHKVLSTIASRCQRFDLSRISSESMKRKLMRVVKEIGIEIEEDVLDLISELSEGSLRDAESLLDQLACLHQEKITLTHAHEAFGRLSRSTFFALDQAIVQTNLSYAFELAEHIFTSGKELNSFLEMLMQHFRFHLVAHMQAPLTSLSEQDQKYYLEHASLFTREECIYLLDFLLNTTVQLSKVSLKQIHLETILLHILRCKKRISVESLLSHLNTLEHALNNNSGEPIAQKKEPIKKLEEETKVENLKKESSKADPAPQSKTEALQSEQAQNSTGHEITKETTSSPPSHKQKGKYDTLIRFAAVELEGSLN